MNELDRILFLDYKSSICKVPMLQYERSLESAFARSTIFFFSYSVRCFLYFLVTFMLITMSLQQVSSCFRLSMQRGRSSQSAVVFRLRVPFFVGLHHLRFCQRRLWTYYGVSGEIVETLSIHPFF